jgi:hypothetical protein
MIRSFNYVLDLFLCPCTKPRYGASSNAGEGTDKGRIYVLCKFGYIVVERTHSARSARGPLAHVVLIHCLVNWHASAGPSLKAAIQQAQPGGGGDSSL